jgi:alcohol dehydrogenase class IV
MAATDARLFSAPTKVIAGLGAIAETADVLRRTVGDEPIALVADRGVAGTEVLERVREAAAGIDLRDCGWVDPDPDFEAAEEIAAAAREAGCRGVLGVGGGSGLGAAKAAALRLTNEQPLTALVGRDRADRPSAPCLAVPTTAGSGSEVSNAFVLKGDDGAASQAVIRGDGYEPRVAILDGTALRSLPDRPMLYAGLDALSHAFEALWARSRSSFTDALALYAADRIFEFLPAALAERRDPDLQVMIEASAIANLACGSAGLGLAHALSAASSVRLAHGYQNGVLLPHVAAFNYEALDGAGQERVDRLAGLYAELGFEARFGAEEVSPAGAAAMVEAAATHVFRENNARPTEEADLRELLGRAGAPLEQPASGWCG